MAERNAGRALKKAEIEARRQSVSTLTLNKVHQTTIALRLGVAQSTVSRDLKIIEAGWREAARADRDALKARELAELDEIERDIVRRTVAKPGPACQLIGLRLRVKERRARLMGLDAPLRTRDETPLPISGWRVKVIEYLEAVEEAEPLAEDVFLDDLTVDQQAQINLWLVHAREKRQRGASLGAQGAQGGQDAQ